MLNVPFRGRDVGAKSSVYPLNQRFTINVAILNWPPSDWSKPCFPNDNWNVLFFAKRERLWRNRRLYLTQRGILMLNINYQICQISIVEHIDRDN